MLGAIIGDIIGSRFEWKNIKTKDFELFNNKCFFTDDSVMTIAVANAILNCEGDYNYLIDEVIKEMRYFGNLYPTCGYGSRFSNWLISSNPQPYNSYGNGSAMRVSSVSHVGKCLEEVKWLSKIVTEVTHNHPEGLKGAEATAVGIYLAKKGSTIKEIEEYIKANYYDFDFTLNEIRDSYIFNETCQGTVPQAFQAFFESISFEDAIRNAISIGGDSDTICAITGSIAEAYYGIPEDIKEKALTYLDENLFHIVNDFYSFVSEIDYR